MGTPDHLTCLLRNLYTGQEATVRTGHRTDWFQFGRWVRQVVYCHPTYLTYMQSTSWEMLDGWSTSWNQDCWESINNLRYADDTALTAESEEELKSLLMEVTEKREKVGLKLNIQKTKLMASDPITSWQIDGETGEIVTDFIFGGLQNHCRWWLQSSAAMKLKDAYSLEGKSWPT